MPQELVPDLSPDKIGRSSFIKNTTVTGGSLPAML